MNLKITFMAVILVLGFIDGANAGQRSDSLKVSLDLAQSDQQNLLDFQNKIQRSKQPIRQITFEFTDSLNPQRMMAPMADSPAAAETIYRKNYPHGDFYYLIGDLDDAWTQSDFARFYSVAKWLAFRGFRTIINVAAYVPDVQEAVSNRHTSAIIWNSHGAEEGYVLETGEVKLPKDVFIKNKSASLKYILFANCYGTASLEYYGVLNRKDVSSFGWDGTVTSEDLFGYLFSASFDSQLAESLKIKLDLTPKKQIVL